MGRKKKKYTTNDQIVDEISEYNKTGVISDTLHLILYDMCIRIGYKTNFINYTFKEDMISDSYFKCLYAIKKFDVNRGNAFAYFTTVIHNTFLSYITKTKKNIEMKDKYKEKLYNEISERFGNIDMKKILEEELDQ